MRTVDPAIWSQKIKKAGITVIRPGGGGRGGGRGWGARFGEAPATDLETSVRRSFVITATEFLKHCSVSGVKFLVEDDLSHSERWRWRFVVLFSLMCGVSTMCVGFMQGGGSNLRGLVVSLSSVQHPIAATPFPAVALCSVNIVSKRAALKLTHEIMSRDRDHHRGRTRYDEHYVYTALVRYGALYHYEYTDADATSAEHSRYLQEVVGVYNATEIMRRLAPSCEELLLRCSWRGGVLPCADLFTQQITSSGFCCVFNSDRDLYCMSNPHSTRDWSKAPATLDLVGHDNGLSVVVSVDQADYAYTARAIVGTEVVVFDPREYALRAGGRVNSHWLVPEVASYLVVDVSVQVAAPATRAFPLHMRRCLFHDEIYSPLSSPGPGGYSQGRCLLACHKRSVRNLCRCVPYFLPPDPADIPCTLEHLRCLNKHKELLRHYYPHSHGAYSSLEMKQLRPVLQEEFQNSMVCVECLPDCERTRYRTQFYVTRYDADSKTLRNYFTHGMELRNRSVVQVFYNTEDQTLYSTDVKVEWYEILSIVGGACAALLSVSVPTLVEGVFFFSVRWRLHFQNYRRRRCLNTRTYTYYRHHISEQAQR